MREKGQFLGDNAIDPQKPALPELSRRAFLRLSAASGAGLGLAWMCRWLGMSGGGEDEAPITPVPGPDFAEAEKKLQPFVPVELGEEQLGVIRSTGIEPYAVFASQPFGDEDGHQYTNLVVFGTMPDETTGGVVHRPVGVYESIGVIGPSGAIEQVVVGVKTGPTDGGLGMEVDRGDLILIEGQVGIQNRSRLVDIPVGADGRVVMEGAFIYDLTGQPHRLTQEGVETLAGTPLLDLTQAKDWQDWSNRVWRADYVEPAGLSDQLRDKWGMPDVTTAGMMKLEKLGAAFGASLGNGENGVTDLEGVLARVKTEELVSVGTGSQWGLEERLIWATPSGNQRMELVPSVVMEGETPIVKWQGLVPDSAGEFELVLKAKQNKLVVVNRNGTEVPVNAPAIELKEIPQGILEEKSQGEYTEEQWQKLQELRGKLETTSVIEQKGSFGNTEVRHQNFTIGFREAMYPEGKVEEMAVAWDRASRGYLVLVDGWANNPEKFVIAPQVEGTNQRLFIPTDEWAEIPKALRLQPQDGVKWYVAYADAAGEIKEYFFAWRKQAEIVESDWSMRGLYAATRLKMPDKFERIIWVEPPLSAAAQNMSEIIGRIVSEEDIMSEDEVLKNEIVDAWIEEMLKEDAEGNLVHFTSSADYVFDGAYLRQALELIKTMSSEQRAFILGFNGIINFWEKDRNFAQGDKISLGGVYLNNGRYGAEVEEQFIAAFIHEILHIIQSKSYSGCGPDDNKEHQAYYLQYDLLRSFGVQSPWYKSLLEEGSYPTCSG